MGPSSVTEAADALGRWSDGHRLVEAALRLYRNWAEVLGDKVIDAGDAGPVPVREVRAEFREQALVFRRRPDQLGPHVVTRLTLTTLGGGCPVGACEVVTRPDGVCESMRVEFGAESFGYSDESGLVAGGGPARFPRVVLPAPGDPARGSGSGTS